MYTKLVPHINRDTHTERWAVECVTENGEWVIIKVQSRALAMLLLEDLTLEVYIEPGDPE